ncbi:MAG: hypothetical protein EA426_18760 [Spirochaetaceae bacterium]|nr:MAG: hypothetical protein EA426_18760 [Spirochaetaceae bacterium]
MKKTRYFGIGAILIAVVLLAACGGASRPASTPAQQRMTLQVTAPTVRDAVTENKTTVTGVISEPSAKVFVNDQAVPVAADGSFTHEISLAYGSNRIAVRAEAEGFANASRTITLNRALNLTVSSPTDNLVVNGNQLTVSGTVSDSEATVKVNGINIPLNNAGSFNQTLMLYYPLTIVNIVAQVEGMSPVTRNFTVTSSTIQ